MNRISFLRTLLDAAENSYTNQCPIMSDWEYDNLKGELKKLNPNEPDRVGYTPPFNSPLEKIKHFIAMGSQNKVNTADELSAWHANTGNAELHSTVKLDGISLACYYENGKLIRAVTRGDGEVGEDITHNAVHFKNLPTTLKNGASCSVRGEVVLLLNEWKELDPQAESNPRNMAAGIARRTDSENADKLALIAFDIEFPAGDDNQYATEMLKAIRLNQLGFDVAMGATHLTKELALEWAQFVGKVRSQLPYLIDGIVFKVNDLAKQREMGVSGGCPRGQVAYKFPAEIKHSVLRKVDWQIGNNGRVTPVAYFTPVQLGGVTVEKATLHNWNEILRKDMAIFDTIEVFRANDVIPAVGSVVHRATLREQIYKPTNIDGHAVLHGSNTDGSETVNLFIAETHPKVQFGKIKNWIKKLDIQGVGDEVLEALMAGSKPLVTSIPDLYMLCSNDGFKRTDFEVLTVNGRQLGMKRAQSILAEIDKTRKLTIPQLLGSLGINHLGRRRVQLIMEAGEKVPGQPLSKDVRAWFMGYESSPGNFGMSHLVDNAALLGIPGIAEDIYESLYASRGLIFLLVNHIEIVAPEKPAAAPTTGTLVGKSFCLTGAASRPRKDIQADIIAAGGVVKDDVSAGLTYLVQADVTSQSSKTKKAAKVGAAVIDETQLMEMINGIAATH